MSPENFGNTSSPEELKKIYYPDFESLGNFEDTRPDWVKQLHGVLSDRDIARMIFSGELKITPPLDLEEALDSCKLDFHLGDKFTRLDYTKLSHIDSKKGIPSEAEIREFIRPGEQIVLPPGELIIAVTREHISWPNYLMGRLEGKSSIARLSTLVEAAPVFDAGWNGVGAMELINVGRLPVIYYEGQYICSFNFSFLTTPAIKSRDRDFGKIRGQTGPDSSQVHKEFQ